MKKVIFIGKTGSGKTTLCQSINEEELKYKKTQSIEIYNQSIDTPGEYLENRFYYKALIVTSADANLIALLYDCTSSESFIPPGFANSFAKEVIGIITKIDLAKSKEDIDRAKRNLESADVSKIFMVDILSGKGMADLKKYLLGD